MDSGLLSEAVKERDHDSLEAEIVFGGQNVNSCP